MFISLIDLSFTRALVANIYGKRDYHCYDPASMFCLEISRVIDGYKDTKSFCRVLRDPQRGLHYWAYAGLTKEHIPSGDDFSNFRAKCGGEKYREILQVLVDIALFLQVFFPGLSLPPLMEPCFPRSLVLEDATTLRRNAKELR